MVALGDFSMVFEPTDMPSDMELEDWIPVFEPIENNETFADEDMPYRLTEETFENAAGMEVPYDEGENETIYDAEDGAGSLWFHWGPVHAEDGLMLKGQALFGGEHGGEAVAETEADIAGEYSASYLGEVRETEDRAEVDVELPIDYDQDDWEDTVDTLAAISQDIGEYHEDLNIVSEQYRR